MTPQKVPTTLAYYPSSAALVPEPLGVALIISAWNFPFLLAMDPLVGAVAAGNAVVVKPSELAPASSALLAKLVPLYLDHSAIRVVEGSIGETTALLQQKWDKIFYTGSKEVGKIVMMEAAKNLTPVTLELGGKCPVIIDSTLDLKVVAMRIVTGKWGMKNGQACLAPDYVLAPDSLAPKLVVALKVTLEQIYGPEPSTSPDLSHIISFRHFTRLTRLLNDHRISDKIAHGGKWNEKRLYIEPTILLDPPLDATIMTEEIFGPLLPIISFDKIEEAFDIVNSMPKPLALYVFTNNKSFEEKVVANISAGGMVVNDTSLHFSNPTLPFEGVGESGIGSYHAKFSFETFSHKKAILYRSFTGDILARYPPYTKTKQALVKCFLSGDFLGIFRILLGWRKC